MEERATRLVDVLNGLAATAETFERSTAEMLTAALAEIRRLRAENLELRTHKNSQLQAEYINGACAMQEESMAKVVEVMSRDGSLADVFDDIDAINPENV